MHTRVYTHTTHIRGHAPWRPWRGPRYAWAPSARCHRHCAVITWCCTGFGWRSPYAADPAAHAHTHANTDTNIDADADAGTDADLDADAKTETQTHTSLVLQDTNTQRIPLVARISGKKLSYTLAMAPMALLHNTPHPKIASFAKEISSFFTNQTFLIVFGGLFVG